MYESTLTDFFNHFSQQSWLCFKFFPWQLRCCRSRLSGRSSCRTWCTVPPCARYLHQSFRTYRIRCVTFVAHVSLNPRTHVCVCMCAHVRACYHVLWTTCKQLIAPLPSLPSRFFLVVVRPEQMLMICCASAYLVGSQVYANCTPTLW